MGKFGHNEWGKGMHTTLGNMTAHQFFFAVFFCFFWGDVRDIIVIFRDYDVNLSCCDTEAILLLCDDSPILISIDIETQAP